MTSYERVGNTIILDATQFYDLRNKLEQQEMTLRQQRRDIQLLRAALRDQSSLLEGYRFRKGLPISKPDTTRLLEATAQYEDPDAQAT